MCQTKGQPQRSTNENSIKPANRNPERPTLLRYWEIENMYKCPVVGMCLTLSEQKQLLKKAGISIKNKNPFDIHEKLVANSDDENRLSIKIDNLLKRKFGREAADLLSRGHQKFIVHWRKVFETDDFQAALWAAAACPDLPLAYHREIFGAVHMTMHWSANQSIKLKQKLGTQLKEMDVMRQSAKEAAAVHRNLRKENKRLRKSEAKLKSRLASSEKEKTRMKKNLAKLQSQSQVQLLEQKNRQLQGELSNQLLRQKNFKHEVAELKVQNAFLTEELEQQKELAGHLGQEVRDIMLPPQPIIHHRASYRQVEFILDKFAFSAFAKGICQPQRRTSCNPKDMSGCFATAATRRFGYPAILNWMEMRPLFVKKATG